MTREVESRRWWVLAAIGIGTFMSALDASVVNTILPVLRRDLHTSIAGIEWVATVYLLVVSALLLGVGRAGDLRGQKRMYISGFGLFVTGSALCGAAPTAETLIGMRALQAIGASMLYANSPAILTKAFHPSERGRALGAQATFTYLGLTAGPSLGGWLAHAFGWRSVFYLNVPVGLLGAFIGWRVIADDRPLATAEPFDWTGAGLFASGLTALLVSLNQAPAWGWTGPRTIVLFAASVVILAAFVVTERRRPSPMLDPALFRSRIFSAATLSALANFICLYSILFVLPFVLIQARGLNTQQAGLVLIAQPVIMAIVAPFSGALSDRLGSRVFATAGMLILGGGIAILASLVRAGSSASIVGALAVVGFGMGLFASPNNSSIMGAAPRNRQGVAAGVLATARNVGMVLGVGISAAVFETVVVHAGGISHLPAVVSGARMSFAVAAGVAVLGAACAAFTGSAGVPPAPAGRLARR